MLQNTNFCHLPLGKLAIFKAIVIGDPTPTVSWKRANGEMNDPQKFQCKYDPTSNEHTLEVRTFIYLSFTILVIL